MQHDLLTARVSLSKPNRIQIRAIGGPNDSQDPRVFGVFLSLGGQPSFDLRSKHHFAQLDDAGAADTNTTNHCTTSKQTSSPSSRLEQEESYNCALVQSPHDSCSCFLCFFSDKVSRVISCLFFSLSASNIPATSQKTS